MKSCALSHRWVPNFKLPKKKRFKAKLAGKALNQGWIGVGRQHSRFIKIAALRLVQILGVIPAHDALVGHFSLADLV